MMTFQNENPKIGDPEEPNGFSHPEIDGAFKPLAPGDHGMMASDQYGQIAAQWESGVQVFAARIRRSSAAAWEGPAAEQSRQAIGNYATRAEDLVPALNALAVQVYESVTSIMRTQTNLPEVIEKRPGWDPREWTILWADNERTDNEEAARQVMRDYYVTGFVAADTKIPVLPVPVNPTQPLHTDLPTDTGDRPGPGGTSTDPGGNPTGTDTGQPDSENPTGEQPGEEEPGEEEPGTEDPGDETDTEEQPGETPAATTPSTTDGPVPTTPSTTTSTPGPGGPGSPSGNPVTTGDPGRTVPGTPNTTGAPAAATAGTTSAGAARSGMPGMMAPGAAGRGQQGDDDKHEIPDYLVTAENTEELLGELPPTVPGGVLGGEVPAAQPPRDT
ncbi:WXG100 family type VII secretion target [Nocardia sp. NPDC003345]